MSLTHIYLDPQTARIVYFSQGDEFPSKSMVIDHGKLRLFAPNTLVKLAYIAELPKALNAQNCWQFMVKNSAAAGESPQLSIVRLDDAQAGSAFAT